jgi:CHAT domain-containing protein/Flp pilus assembly protein TadD
MCPSFALKFFAALPLAFCVGSFCLHPQLLALAQAHPLPEAYAQRLSESEVEERRSQAYQLNEQGVQQFNTGQYQIALQSFQQALDIYRGISDRLGEGQALNNMGVIYSNLGQYLKALDFSQQALVVNRENGNRSEEGNSLNNIGDIYARQGKYPQALNYYQQALTIRQEIGDRAGEGNSLNNIGFIYAGQGQYFQALDHYQQALILLKEIGNRRDEGTILGNIGFIYSLKGQYPQALDYFQQSLVISKEFGDRNGEGVTLNNIGDIYVQLGQYQALDYFQQALIILKETGDRSVEGTTLSNIGLFYAGQRQYPQALDYFQQALVIAKEIGNRSGEGHLLTNIGGIYISQEQYPQALDYFQQALVIVQEIGDRRGESTTLNNIGGIYDRLRQYPQALDYFQQALVIRQAIGDRSGEGNSLSNLGILLLQDGKLAESEDYMSRAIQVLDSLRPGLRDTDKVSLLETQRQTYRYWQVALAAQNKPNQALVASERGRARAFIEQLSLRLDTQTSEQVVSTNVPTLEQIQRIAKEQNSTFIEYSFVPSIKSDNTQGELYIWVIKPVGEIIFHRTDLSQLDMPISELITKSRNSLGIQDGRGVFGVRPRPNMPQTSTAQQSQLLQKLYQLLIDPIASHLPTDPNAKVIFIPQDELFLVPFPALVDNTGKSLIETHTILTSPSIQILEKTRQQRTHAQTTNSQAALVVGNPTMPSVALPIGSPPQALAPLPGSEQEANAISPLFNVQPMLGSQATKASVLQRITTARLVHFATHGLFDDVNGLDSAIALAPDGTGENNDGLLTAAEIAQMKLTAELVVLSACSTGQGRITGDGVIGLSRAFITAGVPSVIVSLWAIPDAPTAELMTDFYRQWKQTGNKAQALRQAMLITKAKYPDPRNWAAFTLIGESE